MSFFDFVFATRCVKCFVLCIWGDIGIKIENGTLCCDGCEVWLLQDKRA